MIIKKSCVNKCCCFSLRTGCKIIGYLELIFIAFGIYGSIVLFRAWLRTFGIVYWTIFLICVCVYLFGVYSRIPHLLICFGIVYIIVICLGVFLFLLFIIAKSETLESIIQLGDEDLQSKRIQICISELVQLLLRIYFAVVVFSYGVKLEGDEES